MWIVLVFLVPVCALFGYGAWMRHGTSGPSVRGRLSRYRPVYWTDRLRDSDPRLKRYVDETPMRGAGSHHKEDWEYGGDKAEWD
jgi:hypothetical protein